MGGFTGFGGLINQNIQQPRKAAAKSKIHENVKSGSVSEKDTNIQEPWYWDPDVDPKLKAEYKKNHSHVRSMPLYAIDPRYYDLAEVNRQARLWSGPNNKHPWYDAPATVKGLSPTFDNKSTKVLKKDGPRQITRVKKTLRYKLLGRSIAIPIHLIIDENHKNLTAKYKKEKMMYMKVFEGRWKVELLYADQERLCKSRSRINEEEYKKCSDGKGRIGSKVTMEQIFQPCSLLNVPPISWFIREITIKKIKNLLEDLRQFVIDMHKNSDPE
ncbi:hypothetical protein AXX17_AT2G23650 [Arabidopsis thaliana]|uniref:DUF220 domain-containing protein n=1 Tax=Arabidopsis thaliana TaxID=3702 RepID=A0A178VPX4_ARATH|nr:hypothetical protein AXX17_AT2G23650 [Arabidopsis thaliana]